MFNKKRRIQKIEFIIKQFKHLVRQVILYFFEERGREGGGVKMQACHLSYKVYIIFVLVRIFQTTQNNFSFLYSCVHIKLQLNEKSRGSYMLWANLLDSVTLYSIIKSLKLDDNHIYNRKITCS